MVGNLISLNRSQSRDTLASMPIGWGASKVVPGDQAHVPVGHDLTKGCFDMNDVGG